MGAELTALLPVERQSALEPQGEGKQGSPLEAGWICCLGGAGRAKEGWRGGERPPAERRLGQPSIVLLPGAWSYPGWHLTNTGVKQMSGTTNSLCFIQGKL